MPALRSGIVRASLGACCWIGVLVVTRPRPTDVTWGHALLLLGPLVLVPMGSAIAGTRVGWRSWSVLDLAQLPAAVLLAIAYQLPQGKTAFLLALPWWGLGAANALNAGWFLARRENRTWPRTAIAVAFLNLIVGGAWAAADRFGYRPLDFDPVIVLLTAIHFHHAGFALPLLTGLAATGRFGRVLSAATIAGVPLVAGGITMTQLQGGAWMETAAAILLALTSLGTAALYLRLGRTSRTAAARWLWLTAGLALAFGMLLAAMYGLRFVLPMEWLNIPTMRALHGTANALGFAFAGFLGWLTAEKQSST